MKYALQADQRIEATPKAIGICPCCGTDMIAKCGDRKVWHWAHKTKRTCDHWWESETQWHRDWKNRFPAEWQEVVHFAEDGEKHIADVKTGDGLVVEFQHSFIKHEEVKSRENFYKQMIWLVDGQRLSRDLKCLTNLFETSEVAKINIVSEPEKFIHKNWLNSDVDVYFDFGHADWLICLLPKVNHSNQREVGVFSANELTPKGLKIYSLQNRHSILRRQLEGYSFKKGSKRKIRMNSRSSMLIDELLALKFQLHRLGAGTTRI